jgi:SAM-dependent methyltransferase/uncharacterized protein YbaR (Trm112 family)
VSEVELRCPGSRAPFEIVGLDEAREELGGSLRPAPRIGRTPIGSTPSVALVREAGWAYPVVDGIPVLVLPERLFGHDGADPSDVTRPPYGEAYAEIEPYTFASDLAAHDAGMHAAGERLRSLQLLPTAERACYPEPPGRWVGGADGIAAQLRAVRSLAPVQGQRILQIGGNGMHALKMLAAGARTAVLVTPVLEELRMCRAVAARAGFADDVTVACGLAEELPLGDDSVDRVYSPSTMHHTETERSFPEIARALTRSGRFASVDVYRSPLYDVGIRLFGKREPNVFCQPLDAARLTPSAALPGVHVTFHGAVFRYPLSVAARRGWAPSLQWAMRLASAEDAMARRWAPVSRLSTLVCVTANDPRVGPAGLTGRKNG